MKYNIEFHIEKLVLHGLAYSDRYSIGEAIECELIRLLSVENTPPLLLQGGEFTHLDGGSFGFAPGTRPEVIGAQVAKGVYGGFE